MSSLFHRIVLINALTVIIIPQINQILSPWKVMLSQLNMLLYIGGCGDRTYYVAESLLN